MEIKHTLVKKAFCFYEPVYFLQKYYFVDDDGGVEAGVLGDG